MTAALKPLEGKVDDALFVDADVYRKAAVWILRFEEEFYAKSYVQKALRVLDRGIERANALASGLVAWTTKAGRR